MAALASDPDDTAAADQPDRPAENQAGEHAGAEAHDSTEAAGKRTTARRTDTANPRTARTRALKVLFQADLRGVSPAEALVRLADDAQARAILDETEAVEEAGEAPIVVPELDRDPEPARQAPPIDGFTRRLVVGVSEHLDELDAVIGRHAHRWQVSRMPAVDRAVLRLAAYELLHEDTPHAVTIDEAVNLAKELSTDDSGRYVNGVLEAIRRTL